MAGVSKTESGSRGTLSLPSWKLSVQRGQDYDSVPGARFKVEQMNKIYSLRQY